MKETIAWNVNRSPLVSTESQRIRATGSFLTRRLIIIRHIIICLLCWRQKFCKQWPLSIKLHSVTKLLVKILLSSVGHPFVVYAFVRSFTSFSVIIFVFFLLSDGRENVESWKIGLAVSKLGMLRRVTSSYDANK